MAAFYNLDIMENKRPMLDKADSVSFSFLVSGVWFLVSPLGFLWFPIKRLIYNGVTSKETKKPKKG